MERCLDSLSAQEPPPEEIVVVEGGDAPTKSIVRRFVEKSEHTTYRHLVSEPGLTRQRNLAITESSGDILHFLDDDAVPDPGYIGEIHRVFAGHNAGEVSGVSPMLRQTDDLSQIGHRLRRFFLLPHWHGQGRLMPSGYGSYPWNGKENEVRPVEIACGCCSYRREIFDHIKFDEKLAGYGFMEDLDFSLRAARHGTILLAPKAVVWHMPSDLARPDERSLAKMQVIHHRYIFDKHLPCDIPHRFCYLWSEFGNGLLRTVIAVRKGNFDPLLGWLEGHYALIRGTGL